MVKIQVLESSSCTPQSSAATNSAWMPSSPDLWHLPQFSPVLPSPAISIRPVQPAPLFAICHTKCTTIFHNQRIKFIILYKILKIDFHFFPKLNKIVNGVPHDIIHKHYKGILYFQNVTHCHSTGINVFSIMATRKVWPSLQRFLRNWHAQQHSVQISYTKFHPNWTLGVETTSKTSFTAYISIKPNQQHYMEILYFKFHPNQSRNMIDVCP